MTMPAVVRVFFAVDLPLAIKEKVGSLITSLKKKSKTNAIRWSRPENLHITLQFLAEVRQADVEPLIENVRHKIEGLVHEMPINFGSLQLFPNPFRPRVIVLDVLPQPELAGLSELIGQGIIATNYEIEQRPYRAHLTLGRIKHAQGVNLHFLSELTLPAFEQIIVDEVVLFRSDPQPEGSKYTPLERISLQSYSLNGTHAG